MVWAGILGIGCRRLGLSRPAAIGILLVGIVLLLASIGRLGASPALASGLTLLIARVLGARIGVAARRHILHMVDAADQDRAENTNTETPRKTMSMIRPSETIQVE